MLDQLSFRLTMSIPNLVFGNAQSIPKAEVFLLPSWDIAVIKFSKRLCRPGICMHPISNGINRITGKHQSGNFPVPFRNSVNVVAQIETQVRHVQTALTTKDILHVVNVAPAKNSLH